MPPSPYIDPFSPYSPFGHAPGPGQWPLPVDPAEPGWFKNLSTMAAPFIGPAASAGINALGLGSSWLGQLIGPGGGPMGPIGYAIGTLLPITMDLIRPGAAKNEPAVDEYLTNVNAFKRDAAQRALGAKQLSGLASLHSDEDIKTSAEWAALGLMGNPEQEADYISHRHQWVPGHPELVQEFLDKAPELKEQNWQAYLDTMDAAANRNLDLTPVGYTPATKPEEFESQLKSGGNLSIWEPPTFDAPRSALNVMDPNAAISAAESYFNLPGERHHAAGSLADVALGHTTYGAGGGVYSEDQLRTMGFTPGHYQQAIHDYLIGRDPSLATNPQFTAMLGPAVAGTDLTPEQISSNDTAFQSQVEDWKQNLREQQNLWQQQWQRYAAEAQQAWTSGGG
jgi:hypothetical protein